MTDTNDNSPTFSEAAYSFDIPEDTGRGAFVGAVSVNDLDEGVNAQVSYTVLSDWGNDVFSLNPQSGVFTLTSRLDYEQVQFLKSTMTNEKKRVCSTLWISTGCSLYSVLKKRFPFDNSRSSITSLLFKHKIRVAQVCHPL